MIPQENTNTRVIEMRKVMQDLEMKCSKKTETLKGTQAKMNMELKNSITQLKTSRESLKSTANQAEDKLSRFGDKVETKNQ